MRPRFHGNQTISYRTPILASPRKSDTLYLYLAVSEASVSAALFKEDENRKQRPIFFVSKSLSEAKTQYTHLKQATLTFHVVAKKLRPYFQAHLIVMLTNLPLQRIIHKPDLSGRMAWWAMELSEFGIQYKPRLALKGEILAYFLVELPQLNVDQVMLAGGSLMWTALLAKRELESSCNLKP